jgi:hypothetical protein
MKKLLWAIPVIVMNGFAFWVVTTSVPIPPSPINLLWLGLVFGVPPLGAFWMWYMAIRYEKRPLQYLLLALIPYFFLGYYFERVRGRHLEAKSFRLTK